jgi:hypothetical protein
MALCDMVRSGQIAGLVSCAASDLLHGCVYRESLDDGWVRPWRLMPSQVRALGSCLAWHPGLFRQMARANSGVFLEVETDSSELALEVHLDGEPSGTRSVLAYVEAATVVALDGIACEIDGYACPPRLDEGIVGISLDAPQGLPKKWATPPLPGFGRRHNVRIWLPCLRGCTVRKVWGDGSVLLPVAPRRQLLVLGDSIAQGFVAGNPACTWPALLAKSLGFDAINQGIGGQVFQQSSLTGLVGLADLEAIVIEFGANYRYERCFREQVIRDAKTYLDEVARLWPQAPCWVLTPLWHDEDVWPTNAKSCFSEVASIIAETTLAHPPMHLVDGMGLLDPDQSLLADGFEHPNDQGSVQIAERLAKIMRAGLSKVAHEQGQPQPPVA